MAIVTASSPIVPCSIIHGPRVPQTASPVLPSLPT